MKATTPAIVVALDVADQLDGVGESDALGRVLIISEAVE